MCIYWKTQHCYDVKSPSNFFNYRLNEISMKLIYRLSAISMKIPRSIFEETDKLSLKFTWKCKEHKSI